MHTTPDPTHPGVVLLGGDMQMWSDLDPGRRSDNLTSLPAAAKLWRLLLRPVMSQTKGRVLLLGAEAAKCVQLLPAKASVDVVVRSRTDAGVVAAARPGTRVWAGSFTRFEADKPYDLVVALDTVESLVTPDDEPTTSDDLARKVDAWVADSGAVILHVLNRVGLDTILAERSVANEEWDVADPGLTLRAVHELVPGGTLLSVVGRVPRVIVGREVSEDARYAGLLSSAVTSAMIEDLDADVVLRDPVSVVPSIIEAGDFERVTPGWIVARGCFELPRLLIDVDHTFGDVSPEPIDEDLLPQEEEEIEPDDEDAEEEIEDAPGDLIEVDSSWSRWIEAQGEGGYVVRSHGRATVLGPLWREAEANGSAADATQSLEGLWRKAAGSGQLELLRDHLRAWSRWVDTLGVDHAWFAFPHNVALHRDGSMSVLDSSWRWVGSGSLEAAKILALRRFAMRLLNTGASHPWPVNISLDGVTEALVLMAGSPWSEELLEQSVRIGERMGLLITTADESVLDEKVERSLLYGRQHQLSLGASLGREAQQRLLNRLSNEAAAQQLKVDWYERHVRRRDGQLNGLERQLESIEASVPYKIARGMTWPGRAAIRGAKGLAKRALPPSAWQKLISYAKKRMKNS